MKITTRLWLAFGALAAMLLAIAAVATYSLTSVDRVIERADRLADERMNPSTRQELADATTAAGESLDSALTAVQAGLAGALIVGAVLAVMIRRRITRPVRALVDGVNRFGAGSLDARIESDPRHVEGELAQAFNNMAAHWESAQVELERLRKQDELILNSAGEGISGLDRDGKVTFANPAAARMLGYDAADLVGADEHALIHYSHADGRPYPIEECPIHGTLVSGEGCKVRSEVFWREDGTSFPVEYTCTPIREAGVNAGAVVTFRDVTEQREIERIKDEFVSVVSHELRTPLTSIRGALGLISSGMLGQVPEKSQRMLDIAVTNADRLVRLINDILDIERMDSGWVGLQRQVCNAADLMTQAGETMRALAMESGVTLSVTPVWAQLNADPDRILQMLTNLLSNAIKFSEWGGRVWLTAERRGDELLVQVGDQGRGIPPDRLDKIFERFQQVDASDSREKGGTGLGLSICRSIVEQHGGRIWAKSTPGKGSVFYCALKLIADAPAERTGRSSLGRPAEETVADTPRHPRERPSILVCDDDSTVVELVSGMLERNGYAVIGVRTGPEALRRAVASPPDAVLLDLVMPEMNGWDIARSLRSRRETRDVPILIMSVLPPEEAPPVSVNAWLRKPLTEEGIVRVLDEAVPRRFDGLRLLHVGNGSESSAAVIAAFERRGIQVLHSSNQREALRLSDSVAPDLLLLDIGIADGNGLAVVEWIKKHRSLSEVPAIVYSIRDPKIDVEVEITSRHVEFLSARKATPRELDRRVADLLQKVTTVTAKGKR